jgi:hypothetical protein
MSTSSVEVRWDNKALMKSTQQAFRAALGEAGKHGRKEIKAELGGAKNSPEGGPPGVDTGTLRKAVSYRIKSRAGRYVAVDVGVLMKSPWDSKAKGKAFPGRMHAQALRLARGYVGTDRLGRRYSQRGRPFVDPVLRREKDRLAQIVQTTASSWMPKAKKG